MSKARIICTIILFAGINSQANSQTATDLERLAGVHSKEHHVVDYSSVTDKSGVLSSLVSYAFLGYKKYISSQDGMNCVFHPSCSAYAMQSVKQKGIFKGSLAAVDRLTRCHGFSQKQYTVHPVSKRLYDPVR